MTTASEMHSVKTAMREIILAYRDDAEDLFITLDGDENHIVHALRRLQCERDGSRWPGRSGSNRMTEYEFDQYARGLCVMQIDTTVRGRNQFCQEPTGNYRSDTDLDALYCEEHADDVRQGY